jgi:hypothetical protein
VPETPKQRAWREANERSRANHERALRNAERRAREQAKNSKGRGASFVAYPQGLLGGGITVGVITALAWLGVPRAGITTLLIVGSAVAAIAAVAYAVVTSRRIASPTQNDGGPRV